MLPKCNLAIQLLYSYSKKILFMTYHTKPSRDFEAYGEEKKVVVAEE